MNQKKISDLGEFGFLKKLLPRLYWPSSLNSQLCIGAGDDAGVVRVSGGKVLVATTDSLVEGVHFERNWLSPQDLGEKLLAVNLSDLAAMGNVKPLAALLTVAIPGDTAVETVDKFYKGLRNCAQRWKIGFLGGDTVGSKHHLVVSATVLGEARLGEIVRRQGASEGDLIAAVGPLGLSSAGLQVLQMRATQRWTKPLVDAFWRPRPQFEAGRILGQKRLATSMTDASDGLEASVRLLCEASQLGALVDTNQLPIAPELRRWAERTKQDVLGYILRGGEDYALVFTVSPRRWSQISRLLPTAFTFGRMTAKRDGRWTLRGGRRLPLESYGYAHF
jgi:thiamine-monophosphate kinase